MSHKEIRSERQANLVLADCELPVLQFHPNFLRAAPLRKPQEKGIIKTFRKLLGR
jgi:hypothetical protein